jgi:hypothetical protein
MTTLRYNGGVSKKKGKPDEVDCRENIVRLKGMITAGCWATTTHMITITAISGVR